MPGTYLSRFFKCAQLSVSGREAQQSFLQLNLEAAQVREEDNHQQPQFLVQWFSSRPDLGGGATALKFGLSFWNTLLQKARPRDLGCPCSSSGLGVSSTPGGHCLPSAAIFSSCSAEAMPWYSLALAPGRSWFSRT